MNVDLAQELLNELGSSLKNLETEQAALLQFLKDNGVLTDDQFAPYLAQAGKASSVRWRAAHVRLERLFSSERQKEEKLRETEKRQTGAGQAPIQNQDQEPEPKTKNDADGTTPRRGPLVQRSMERAMDPQSRPALKRMISKTNMRARRRSSAQPRKLPDRISV